MVRAWLNLPVRRWVCADNGGGQVHGCAWEEKLLLIVPFLSYNVDRKGVNIVGSELVLLVLEKFQDNTKLFVGLVVFIFFMWFIYIKRINYIVRCAYINPKDFKEIWKHNREMLCMFPIVMCLNHIVGIMEAQLYGENTIHIEIYCIFFVVLTAMCVFRRVGKIVRNTDFGVVISFLYLLPSIVFYSSFVLFVFTADKDTWLFWASFVFAFLSPFLELPLFYMLSPKDTKYIKLVLESGEEYDVPFRDALFDNKNGIIAVRKRDDFGQHVQTVKISNDKVKSQELYLRKPKIK